ncbi:acetyl-CoA carboxylase biotin carboxyl carrier protein subunit [Dyadobacter sp. CY326]|uniref:acetyl-CoA carboxylase biotin carboxyl carrier protein subunit n=1 Tax=Dyadobacter sp. CY326 TaxID=2907300 RepID=UPI001F186B01|nr:acetyl-CoA carboxylase biotin carboxyl carrier protein subunit [Dyadobacter sp. CY326]MCE7066427.1 acetyl-CoA carboxylase biotin carboxyl carrier protein subunit [Dyadobacter sp. CY326]
MLKVTVSANPAIENADDAASDQFLITKEKGHWSIGGQLFEGDIVPVAKNHFHAIWQNKSYNIELLDYNAAEKTFHLLINGQHFYTKAKDELDLLLEGMGLQNSSSTKINNVKAPMPGLIQSVAVSEGDTISKGDNLLVLVAMKMENTIKSSGNGIVKTLKVSAGQIVEKNQVLLEFQ